MLVVQGLVLAVAVTAVGAARFERRQTTNATDGASTYWAKYSNMAIKSNTLREIWYMSRSECSKVCDEKPDCVAYVDRPSLDECSLKSRLEMYAKDGKDVYAKWAKYSNKAISGKTIETISDSSLSECVEACRHDAECVAFVHKPSSEKCSLKSKVEMYAKGGQDVYVKSGAIVVDVRVLVLVKENGQGDSSAPWYDKNAGTMPLDSDGDVTQAGSTAANLTTSDIVEIFKAVNEFYAPTGVRWNVIGPFFVRPTVPCNGVDLVCGRHKCRSSGYFTKYWGTINKKDSHSGREERGMNFLSLVPREYLKSGSFHLLYTKFIGWKSQGVVIGSDRSDAPYIRPSDDPGRVSVANCGQWSNKYTDSPERRPNVIPCDGRENCGRGLAYTSAHELGHLFGLGHTDAPSIMQGGGKSQSDSQFSPAQKSKIRSRAEQGNGPVDIDSLSEFQSGRPDKTKAWRSNTMCMR